MKIRNDFVSNSSSVSYIITMNKEIVELFKNQYSRSNPEYQRITELLKNDISENGTRVYLEGEEMFTRKIKFQTDGDIICRESIKAEGKEFKLEDMNDEELWAYILGEYICSGRIASLSGFGSTQVETY